MNIPRVALFSALLLGFPSSVVQAHVGKAEKSTTTWWCVKPSPDAPVEHCWLTEEKFLADPSVPGPRGAQCSGTNPVNDSTLKRWRYQYRKDGSSTVGVCGTALINYVCHSGYQVLEGVNLDPNTACIQPLAPPPSEQASRTEDDAAHCLVLRTLEDWVTHTEDSVPATMCKELPRAGDAGSRFCEMKPRKGVTVFLPDKLIPGNFTFTMEFTGNVCALGDAGDGEQCINEAGMNLCDLNTELGCVKVDGVNVCWSDIPAGGCTMAGAKQICDSSATAPPAVDDGTAGNKAAPAVTIAMQPLGDTPRSIDIFDGATVTASSAPPEGEDAKGDPLKEGEVGGGDPLCKEFPNVVACQPASVVIGGVGCLSPPVCAGGDAALCALLHTSWQERCAGRLVQHGIACTTPPNCFDRLSTQCETVTQIWEQRCAATGGSSGTASGGDSCDAPPTCSGDAIQCNILKQEWHSRCDALGTTASNDAILSGKGDNSLGTLVQDTVNLGESLEATEVFSNACPPDVQLGPFTIAGTSQGPWAIQSATFCGLFTDARPFVLAAAWIGAAFIVLGAGRAS